MIYAPRPYLKERPEPAHQKGGKLLIAAWKEGFHWQKCAIECSWFYKHKISYIDKDTRSSSS